MNKKVIVAVHGIGDQFRYETIQSVAAQFCQYYGQTAAIPLGRLHSTLYMSGSDTPVTMRNIEQAIDARKAVGVAPAAPLRGPAAVVLDTKPGPMLPPDLEFAEVYWADIPRGPANDAHTLEESKRWAHTVVGRVRMQYESDLDLQDHHYLLAATALEEMIETIHVMESLVFLAEKAGVFKFDLAKVLVDYLGDVQVVTEFKVYRESILQTFDKVMSDIHALDPTAEIFIVAHSEGTVVAFMGLLRAFSNDDRPDWANCVRGMMTIGAPINKHLLLWPELWTDFKLKGPALAQKIQWRNYYDYGDPVGFDLQATREWLFPEEGSSRPDWRGFFEFTADHDFGFARYPFPGKAHNDYWTDAAVFGHFIQTVVKPPDPKPKPESEPKPDVNSKPAPPPKPKHYPAPGNKMFCFIFSPVVPYALALILCYLGVYFLYKGVGEFIQSPESAIWVVRNVGGVTALLAALTVAARIPRLTQLWRWYLLGWGMVAIAAVAYRFLVHRDTQHALDAWVEQLGLSSKIPPPWGVVSITILLALFVPIISGRSAKWGGTRLLIAMGGLVILGVVLSLVIRANHSNGNVFGPVWPLLLGSAAFLYLWWLAALIFDLAFVWQRYIRCAMMENRLLKFKREQWKRERETEQWKRDQPEREQREKERREREQREKEQREKDEHEREQREGEQRREIKGDANA